MSFRIICADLRFREKHLRPAPDRISMINFSPDLLARRLHGFGGEIVSWLRFFIWFWSLREKRRPPSLEGYKPGGQ